jgi:undecaprenyl phosphate-alpha-L-ara4N flippase subunit ArnF
VSRRGLAYALTSVMLVSASQLAMRWGMMRLPGREALAAGAFHLLALTVVLLGVLGYLASALCWLGALANLPLGRAYSLLGLSYPLVYLCAALLPGLDGSLSAGKSFGVMLVLIGVVLVHARR